MKSIVAFVGSARKKHTHNAVTQFLANLQSFDDIQSEVVGLSDFNLKTCTGCKLCFAKGEEFCPLKDDRDLLLGKMLASDGVVFASPNYSFHVSAIMKTFLDRLGFVFHRPRFFGKAFTDIVVQGIYGGSKIVKYLDFVGDRMGFITVKGSCITALEPMTEKQQLGVEKILLDHSSRFYKLLNGPQYPIPTLSKLLVFRMSRTSLKQVLNDSYRDYTYYRENGWFESSYFYPTRLGLIKKAAGSTFDRMAARMSTKR